MSWIAGGETKKREVPDSVLVKRLMWKFVVPFKGVFALSLVIMIVSVVFELAGPYILKIAIDDYILAGRPFEDITFIAGVFLVVAFVAFLLEFVRIYLITVTGQKVVYKVREDLVHHLQFIGLDYFDTRETGKIISRTTNDTERLSELLTSGVLEVVVNSFQIVGILAILLTFDVRLSGIALLSIPLITAVVIVFRKKARPAYQRTRKTIGEVTASFQENISGVMVSQVFNREEQNRTEFKEINTNNYNARLRTIFLFSLLFPSLDMINGVVIAIIVWVGGSAIVGGSSTITIGVLVAFLSYLNRFFRPILTIAMFYNQLQSGLAATERIFDLLDEEPSVKDPKDGGLKPEIRGHLVFDNVRFGYNQNAVVLDGISFEVHRGRSLALVGHTGAGKTTIANLVSKFYPFGDSTNGSSTVMSEGAILVDGSPLSQYNTDHWRQNLGIVPQDGFLFSGTIRDNIKYGKRDASDEEVIAVAQRVGAWSFIQSLSNGLDTEVGERGGRLSHGERQLVCFARAILPDPPIFILDEATSAIDAHTEQIIQASLDEVLKNRTSIIIAHRLSTIRNVDHILMLENGKVIEEGSFDELIGLDGKFASNFRKQFVES